MNEQPTADPDPDTPSQEALARRFAWQAIRRALVLDALLFAPMLAWSLTHLPWWRSHMPQAYVLLVVLACLPIMAIANPRWQLAEQRKAGVLLTEDMLLSSPEREFVSPLDPITTFDLCADRLSGIGMATVLGYSRPPAFRYDPFGGRITIARRRPFWLDGSVVINVLQEGGSATRVRVRRRAGGWVLTPRLGQGSAIVDKICAELEQALQARRAAMDATARAGALEKAALQARLHAMQAQVEPHFLYNTLANLKYLIRTDAERAQAMVDHLVGYFQAALPDMRSESSTVERELDLAEHYLSLMQIRMGARLRFRIDVDPAALACRVPPAMLVSLVENAVKHGLEKASRAGTVVVACRLERRWLELAVADDGVGLGDEQTGEGVGLANIQQRLRLLYGDAAMLRVEPNTPTGVVATLRLPKET